MRISDWSSDVCSSDLFEGRRSVRLAVNSASSTIPCRASSSLISRCSHYVCQIVVWRTNLEVTPWTDDSTRPALLVMWKFDYYDRDLEFGSAETWNPDATTRVLTILLTSEYYGRPSCPHITRLSSLAGVMTIMFTYVPSPLFADPPRVH